MDPKGDEIQPGRRPGPEDVRATPPPTAPPPNVAVGDTPSRNQMILFWASFLTLIAGGIGFAVRGGLLGAWGQQFGFTQFDLGKITGAGLWGFPIAIIPLSFIVDRVGYRPLMVLAFSLHVLSAVVTLAATPLSTPPTAQGRGLSGASIWGTFIFSLGQRRLRIGHQPADGHAVSPRQDPLAQHPPRRLARRPDPRRPDRPRFRRPRPDVRRPRPLGSPRWGSSSSRR